MSTFDVVFMVVKVVLMFALLMQVAPIMAWVERRGSAVMQNRSGPNRLGPLGLFQSIADAIKFLRKEDPVPGHVNKIYYLMAPVVSLVPALMTFAVIPFAAPMEWNGHQLHFHAANLNVGVLYVFAIASLGVYGIIMAGWSSNNKYALLGGLRSSAQMISYELSMGLSIIGLVMVFSSIHLGDIAAGQGQVLWQLGPISIPKWGIFIQPLGFLIFITAAFAETNRLPFDLPEGESEIVAGYHLEYGSMKFAIYMMAEYMNMATASGLIATLFFGGYQMLPGMASLLGVLPLDPTQMEWARVVFQGASLFLKVAFFMWFYVWVRWTLPRFRYDQLMDLGWKVMLPLSLINIFITALMIHFRWV
jgi:NADH-quinone oxidoreductase subunit H